MSVVLKAARSRFPPVASRDGIVVLELLVALLLSVLILSLLATTMLAQSQLAREIGERIAYNDAARAALHIIPAEVRLSRGSDLRATTPDSLSGRWVRSSGIVCASRSPDVWLRMRGLRDPDASKDSLLVIDGAGESTARMTSIAKDGSACAAAAGDITYRARMAGRVPTSGVALIFESGNYYLSQRALRYRLGGEGRQPLTEEYFRDGASRFTYIPGDGMTSPSFRITLGLKPQMQHATGRSAEAFFYMLNSDSTR